MALFPDSELPKYVGTASSEKPAEWSFKALAEYQSRVRLLRGFHGLLIKAICGLLDANTLGKLSIKKEFKSLGLSKRELQFIDDEQFWHFEFTHSVVLTVLWDDLEFLAFRYLGDWLENNWNTISSSDLGSTKIRDRQRKCQLRELDTKSDEFTFLDAAHAIALAVNYQDYHGAERLARIVQVSGIRVPHTLHIRRDLAELETLRHTLVHRQGWPGRKFMEFDPSAGDPFGTVSVRSEDMVRYGSAVATFVKQFERALRKSYGSP